MNSEEDQQRVDRRPLLDEEEVDNEAYPQVRIDEEGNAIQERQDNPEYQRSYRRDQRRAENLKKQINDSITEIVLYAAAIVLIILWLSFSASEHCNEPIQLWTLGSLAAYMVQLVIACYGYHYLKKWHSFSVKTFFVSGAVSIVYTIWLLWGNVQYYDENSDCATKAADLMVLQCILLIFGYFDMMKCLVFTCIGSCFLIFRARERRHGPRLNWMPAPDQFLKKLPLNKFNPSENSSFDTCIICMAEYVENEQITTLPCDEKHYFHPKCIEGWLSKNNSCPLCKKPVTLEDIKRFKKAQKQKKKNSTRNSSANQHQIQ